MAHTSIRADNWEVACCGSAGGGAAITAGGWVFQFRNRQLNQRATVGFAGPGVGAGLRLGTTGDANWTIEDDDFVPIETIGRISLDDLNGATGWVNSGDLAAGPLGVGVMWITANSMRGTLFAFQCIYGYSSGIAASANLCSVGVWGLARNSGIKPYLVKREPVGHDYPPWAQIKCRVARQSISVGARGRVNYHYDAPVPFPGESVLTP